MSAADIVADFTAAALRHDIEITNPIADGEIHRCRVTGASPRKRDAAYVLHLDDHPAGGFGHYKGGWRWHKWRYANGSNGTTTKWTPAEHAAFDAERAARKKVAEEERRRLKAAAAGEAVAMYGNADLANPAHPYLARKQVKPHGIRQRGNELLVPRRDMVTDELVNLQRILPNGDKLNLKDGRVDNTWFIIGKPQAQGTILLGEGFATAATGHEETGHAAAVAFGADKLKAAALELRKQHPEARIVVLADDDWRVRGNPGLTKATEAALVADALLAVPTFGSDREDGSSDFNDMRRLVGADAVRGAVENAAKPPSPNGNDEAAADQGGGGGGRGPKQADMLIALAQSAELFHTPAGIGFADLDINGHRETWPIRRKDFRHWLARRFFKATGSASNSEALQSALNVIEAKAHFDAPQREVYIRVGGLDGTLYLDLCDNTWRAVEIDGTGWRVIDRPPVRFRRAAGMKALPVPQPGGSIKPLRSFLNVASDADFVLAVSWALAGLRDRGPYPVLVLSGEQGSAKSTFAAILRALLDPNTAPLRALSREDRDLFIAANNGHVLAFDNVSGLRAWISDTLCRLATGGGFAARQLYTDQDEMLFDACRPVILNGIEDIVNRPDLADRALFLTLEPIAEEKRRLEAELWSEFEVERPRILGGLLDAVVEGLKRLPETHLPKLPRMADFATWGTACEPALWSAGTFWSAYSGNIAGSVEAVIDADPVADAVHTMMTKQREWTGTAKELLNAVVVEVADERITKSKSWPATPEALRGRLRRAATGLRKIGINILFPGKRDRPRNIHIGGATLASSRPENGGARLSELSEPSRAMPKANDDKDLASARQPTVIRHSDGCKEAEPTVGPTAAANPLKLKVSDRPDSPDSENPTQSASDEPEWEIVI